MVYFGGFEAMFTLVFLLAVGIILARLIQGIGQWNKNNHSPRLTVDATVVTKRTNVSCHSHPNGGGANGMHSHHSTASTTYYATFQVESGGRMELTVGGADYGQLAEGDRGKLSFQGTRYLGFERYY